LSSVSRWIASRPVRNSVEGLLERLDRGLVGGLGLVVELVDLGEGDGLAVAQGGEGEAVGRAEEGDARGLGGVLHGLDELLLRGVEGLLQGPAAGAVLLAAKHRGDGRGELVDELVEVLAEGVALAGREAQDARAVPLVEVLDVAPVVGRRLGARAALQGLEDGAVLARPGAPRTKRL
jgi:hypothetical protein